MGDEGGYVVVVNDEEQFSVLRVDESVPEGWRRLDVAGRRGECLDWIAAQWSDLRPRSVRERLGAAQR